MLKKLFCKHDYISLGTYYDTAEGDWIDTTPLTYVDVWEAVKCTKCHKVKHNKLLSRKFIGWNNNRDYQYILLSKGIPEYDDWLLK